jgi:hypothetical protein
MIHVTLDIAPRGSFTAVGLVNGTPPIGYSPCAPEPTWVFSTSGSLVLYPSTTTLSSYLPYSYILPLAMANNAVSAAPALKADRMAGLEHSEAHYFNRCGHYPSPNAL